MNHEIKKMIDELVDACHRAAECGLVRLSSGNMSRRLDDGLLAVTAKGTWLGRLTRDEIAVCRIDDVSCINGKTPSVESKFHAGIYRARPDVNAVLHCQSPCATAIACGLREPQAAVSPSNGGAPLEYDFQIIPEIPFYVGVPAVIAYGTPGSPELAAAIIEAVNDHDLVIMQNHGQTAVGKTLDDVIQKAGFFELACEILLKGQDIRPMPQDAIDALRARAMRERSA